jgi:hypothetical protein
MGENQGIVPMIMNQVIARHKTNRVRSSTRGRMPQLNPNEKRTPGAALCERMPITLESIGYSVQNLSRHKVEAF